jgi:hypothetical protein
MNYTKHLSDASLHNFLVQVPLFQEQDLDFYEHQSWICELYSGMVNHMQLPHLPGHLVSPTAVAKPMGLLKSGLNARSAR